MALHIRAGSRNNLRYDLPDLVLDYFMFGLSQLSDVTASFGQHEGNR